jgi:outer membrane protein
MIAGKREMNCSTYKMLSAFILALLVPVFAHGENKKVSLKECIEIASQNNPEIKLSAEEQNTARAYYNQKNAENIPQLYAFFRENKGSDADRPELNPKSKYYDPKIKQAYDSGEYKFDNNSFIQLQAGVAVTYPLVDPSRKNEENVALKRLDMYRLMDKKTKDSILTNVKRLYYECLFAKKTTELRQKMITNFEKRLASIRVLVRTGDKPIFEQSSAEVSLSQAKLDFQRSNNFEQQQKAELKAAMGLLQDATDLLLEDYAANIPVLKYSLDEIYRFVDDCTELRIAKINAEMNRERIYTARAQHLPKVDFTASYLYQNSFDVSKEPMNSLSTGSNWSPQWFIALEGKLSIFSGGAIEAMADGALSEYNKSLYNNQKVLINVRKDATNLFNKLTELKEQLSISRLNIENARVNLNLAQRSYDGGVGNLFLVQGAETSLLQTEMYYAESIKSYYQTLAALASIIGVDEEVLCAQ